MRATRRFIAVFKKARHKTSKTRSKQRSNEDCVEMLSFFSFVECTLSGRDLSAWDVMGMACCTQWTVEKRIQRFGRNT
jgi:hypothetical protein